MDCFSPCFMLPVTGDHQTTTMVIYHYNALPGNQLNSWYVISEAYNKANTICMLLFVVVVDDQFA